MADNKYTTVQIDQETDRKLAVIAEAYERTKAGQLRFWVNSEYDRLEKFKLLPGSKTTGPVDLSENIQ